MNKNKSSKVKSIIIFILVPLLFISVITNAYLIIYHSAYINIYFFTTEDTVNFQDMVDRLNGARVRYRIEYVELGIGDVDSQISVTSRSIAVRRSDAHRLLRFYYARPTLSDFYDALNE